MRWHKNMIVVGAVIAALAATTAAALGSTAGRTVHKHKADEVRLALTPSSSVLGACMPGAELNVKIALKPRSTAPTGSRSRLIASRRTATTRSS